jgi:site-specific DNA-cytosine methylase
MDYTVRSSETIAELRKVLKGVLAMYGAKARPARSPSGVDEKTLRALLRKLTPSLPIRLLLEELSTPQRGLFDEDEGPHHLLADAYLSKGTDSHGDWFERLDPDKPCKTVVSHMARDTYSFFHPWQPRPLTVRETARVQCFPDWYEFGTLGMCDAYEVVGNAVPPLLAFKIAENVAAYMSKEALAIAG